MNQSWPHNLFLCINTNARDLLRPLNDFDYFKIKKALKGVIEETTIWITNYIFYITHIIT